MEQVPERADVVLLPVDVHAGDHVGEHDTPEEGGDQRRPEDGVLPVALPALLVPLVPVLERHTAHDQADQDQQQREVEAAEQRRVPVGEGREGRAGGREQPDLVPVPDRADGVDQHAALGGVARQQSGQDADAEVEALEEEVADPQDGDEDEPDVVELHALSVLRLQ